MPRSILLLFCLSALLRAQVSTPKVGFVRYDDGTLRLVQGIEASFVLGKPAAASVDAASFSDSGGIISAKGLIRLIREDTSEVAEYQAGESHPVLNIADDLSTAAAWLPSRQSVLYWNGAAFAATALTNALPGHVTSLRVQGHRAELLVLSENTTSIVVVSLDSGDELSNRLLPGITGPAIQFKSYVLFHDEDGLEIESADGSRVAIPLVVSDLTFEGMASDWVHLKSPETRRHWALHLTETGWHVSELPRAPRGEK